MQDYKRKMQIEMNSSDLPYSSIKGSYRKAFKASERQRARRKIREDLRNDGHQWYDSYKYKNAKVR